MHSTRPGLCSSEPGRFSTASPLKAFRDILVAPKQRVSARYSGAKFRWYVTDHNRSQQTRTLLTDAPNSALRTAKYVVETPSVHGGPITEDT